MSAASAAVMTREDCRGRGYASLALAAAIDTMRANEAVRFALLFCEEHNYRVLSRAGLGAVRQAKSGASSRTGASASI